MDNIVGAGFLVSLITDLRRDINICAGLVGAGIKGRIVGQDSFLRERDVKECMRDSFVRERDTNMCAALVCAESGGFHTHHGTTECSGFLLKRER